MKFLRNFSIFYGDQNLLDSQISRDFSQRKLSSFSENDFPKVKKINKNKKKVEQKLELEKDPF